MDKISLKHAKLNGLTFYFTGKPCKNNHISTRRVANSTCCECELKYHLERNPDKRSVSNKAYYDTNRTQILSKQRKRYTHDKDHRDRLLEIGRQWRLTNRKCVVEMSLNNYNNKGQHNARTANRRAAKLRATPHWYEKSLIDQLYVQARHLTESTKIGYQVDHIIPLHGELVCGLHCLDNLQIIIASENKSKSNKFKV